MKNRDAALAFDGAERISEGDAEAFKCAGCGANMRYEPSAQKLVCDHCGSEVDIAADTNVTERDFSELEEHRWAEAGLKTVRCDNCGATETVKGDEIATVCPFCSSPLVLEEHCFDGVKPDSLIPFSLDRQKGLEACKKWLKKRFFAPSKFKKNINVTTIRGVYYPVWTFDSTTDTVYAGRLGKTYTTTRRDSKGNTHTEVKVRYFNVSGTRRNYFDDVTVNGGAFVSDKNLSKLQPFPQNRYVVYSSEFLAGFFANNYTVDPYTAFKTAEDRMRETIRRQIIASYNADVVDYLNMSMNHVGKSFKYMLMPVYITATKYRDKLYNQYVNGCTGKITGSAPVSPLKVSVVSLLGAAVIAGVVLLLKFFGAF